MNTGYPDIYYLPEYSRLHEEIENGVFDDFRYVSDYGTVYLPFLRRSLSHFSGFEGYYDAITPYGYGGPVILDCAAGKRRELAADFYKEFTKYCMDTRIITFFIRFHPILENSNDFKTVFEVIPIRKTIAVDLSKENVLADEIESETRRVIKKALSNDMRVEFDYEGKTLDTFLEIYYSTMDKNHAKKYYYFSKEYFLNFIDKMKGHIQLAHAFIGDKAVASTFNTMYGEFAHGNYGGTAPGCYKYFGFPTCLYSIACEFQKKGYKWFHIGGGITNNPDDSIFLFKRKFTKNGIFSFDVSKLIFDHEIYERLCNMADEMRGKTASGDYFPQYRA